MNSGEYKLNSKKNKGTYRFNSSDGENFSSSEKQAAHTSVYDFSGIMYLIPNRANNSSRSG